MRLPATFATLLAVLATVVVGLIGAPGAAVAATPITGTYTLHYEWYSAPGSRQTSQFGLKADHTCTGFTQPCTWQVSGGHFTLHFPNPRRGGVTYDGTVTTTGLNSASSYGGMYYDTTGSQQEGLWYADKIH